MLMIPERQGRFNRLTSSSARYAFSTARLLSAATALAFSGLTASSQAAVVEVTLDVPGGNWSNASTWDLTQVPNNVGGTTYIANVGGAVVLDGNFTIDGLIHSSGEMSGNGDLNLVANSAISGGDFIGSGLLRNTSTGTLLMQGSTKDFQRNFLNDGTVNWTGGALRLETATVTNSSGALFNLNNTGTVLSNQGVGGQFVNAGTFHKNVSTSTSTIAVTFNNDGIVDSDIGTIALTAGGTHSGEFAGDATIQFSGGTHTFNAGYSGTANSIKLSSGTLDFAATGSMSNLQISSGVLTGNGNVTLTGANNTMSGGQMTGSGTTTIAGTLTYSGSTRDFVNRTVVTDNGGTSIWSGGANELMDSISRINVGGTFDITSSGTVFTVGTGSTTEKVENFGVFRKSGSTSTATVNAPFENAGVVDVQVGTLSFVRGGTYTGGFEGPATVQFNGGTHVFQTGYNSTAGTFRLSSGTLDFDDDGTVANVNITSGVMLGDGTVSFDGTSSWTGGSYQGTGEVRNIGTLTVSGSTKTIANGTVANASGGELIWAGGNIQLNDGTLENRVGGTLRLSTSGTFMTNNGGTNVLVNQGTLVKDSSTSTATIATTLNNSGTVDVQNGTLSLPTMSIQTGHFTGPGMIDFSGGIHNFETGYSSDIATLRISSGTVNFNAPGTINHLNQIGGVINGLSTVTVGGTSLITGGSMAGAGTTRNIGEMTFVSSTKTFTDRTVVNADGGHMIWNGGNIRLDNALVHNEVGGLFEVRSSSTVFTNLGGSPSFSNLGTFQKTTSTSTATVNVPFNNAGVVTSDNGTLSLTGGGTHSGEFTGNAIVQFGGGTHTFMNGYSGTGQNFRVISPATVDFAADGAIQNLQFNSGTLLGIGTVTTTGTSSWTSGTWSGTGTTRNVGQLNLVSSSRNLVDRTFANATGGTVTWSGGLIRVNDAIVRNNIGATWEIASSGTVISNDGGSPQFINVGTLRKTTSTSTATIGIDVTNRPQGIIDVQVGTLSISGGTLTNQAGGYVIGEGRISTPDAFVNAGTISPGTGTIRGREVAGELDVTNDLTFTSTGRYAVDIQGDAVGEVDLLDINGDLALDGILETIASALFTPDPSDLFTIIEATNITGEFVNAPRPATIDGLGASTGSFGEHTFTIIYEASAIRLENVMIPEPASAGIVSFAIVGLLRRRR